MVQSGMTPSQRENAVPLMLEQPAVPVGASEAPFSRSVIFITPRGSKFPTGDVGGGGMNERKGDIFSVLIKLVSVYILAFGGQDVTLACPFMAARRMRTQGALVVSGEVRERVRAKGWARPPHTRRIWLCQARREDGLAIPLPPPPNPPAQAQYVCLISHAFF